MFKRMIDVNLLGVIYGTALALHHGSNNCSVVNIASLAGLIFSSHDPVYTVKRTVVNRQVANFVDRIYYELTGIKGGSCGFFQSLSKGFRS